MKCFVGVQIVHKEVIELVALGAIKGYGMVLKILMVWFEWQEVGADLGLIFVEIVRFI